MIFLKCVFYGISVETTAALRVSSMDMTVTFIKILFWGWYNQYNVLASFQEIMYFVCMYIIEVHNCLVGKRVCFLIVKNDMDEIFKHWSGKSVYKIEKACLDSTLATCKWAYNLISVWTSSSCFIRCYCFEALNPLWWCGSFSYFTCSLKALGVDYGPI